MRPGKATFICTLVLGVLQTLQQTGYLGADLSSKNAEAAVTVGDVLGLVSGACLVVSSVMWLKARRRTTQP